MFALYKIISILMQPSCVAALVLLAGLVLVTVGRRRKLGLKLAWGGLVYLFAVGIVPFGNLLILPLEQQYSGVTRPASAANVTGIIILGGFEDGWVSAGRGALAINESGERLTEGVRLARQLADAKVLFSGGVGALWRAGQDATAPVAAYLESAGIARSRILLEGTSRNTVENAKFSAALVQPKPGERWVLVTSAYHMPRAVGLFRKAGFTVLPWPVDYRTRGPEDIWRFFDRLPAGHQRFDLAATEWLGLLAAWLTGSIDELLPAP